jgi:hypothetical protein
MSPKEARNVIVAVQVVLTLTLLVMQAAVVAPVFSH